MSRSCVTLCKHWNNTLWWFMSYVARELILNCLNTLNCLHNLLWLLFHKRNCFNPFGPPVASTLQQNSLVTKCVSYPAKLKRPIWLYFIFPMPNIHYSADLEFLDLCLPRCSRCWGFNNGGFVKVQGDVPWAFCLSHRKWWVTAEVEKKKNCK